MARNQGPVAQLADLDEIDLKILRVLAGNGRITNLDLSEAVNLSTAPTLRRVKSLEQRGVIKGYTAVLDSAKVGLPTIVFVAATLNNQGAEAAVTFEGAVRSQPEVLECHQIAGEFDYLLKVVAPSLEAYQIFITGLAARTQIIAHLRSLIPMKRVKTDSPLPI
jgi:Lrp/AsnC family leucine-responsive transcriptional regulator